MPWTTVSLKTTEVSGLSIFSGLISHPLGHICLTKTSSMLIIPLSFFLISMISLMWCSVGCLHNPDIFWLMTESGRVNIYLEQNFKCVLLSSLCVPSFLIIVEKNEFATSSLMPYTWELINLLKQRYHIQHSSCNQDYYLVEPVTVYSGSQSSLWLLKGADLWIK